MNILKFAALGTALAGCVTRSETVVFHAADPNQQAMMRDGQQRSSRQ
jgi:hypothetical protein